MTFPVHDNAVSVWGAYSDRFRIQLYSNIEVAVRILTSVGRALRMGRMKVASREGSWLAFSKTGGLQRTV